MTRIQELEERILDRTASEAEQLEYDELVAERVCVKPVQTVAEFKASGHTPGPWIALDDSLESGKYWIHSKKSKDPKQFIAAVNCEIRKESQQNANARLIAAAPALLEALEQILADTAPPRGSKRHPCVLNAQCADMLYAAIAKARGE